jgi:hypothetical protein
VSVFAWATITKYHTQGGLNTEICVLTDLEFKVLSQSQAELVSGKNSPPANKTMVLSDQVWYHSQDIDIDTKHFHHHKEPFLFPFL